jgi:hypothetical protein
LERGSVESGVGRAKRELRGIMSWGITTRCIMTRGIMVRGIMTVR